MTTIQIYLSMLDKNQCITETQLLLLISNLKLLTIQLICTVLIYHLLQHCLHLDQYYPTINRDNLDPSGFVTFSDSRSILSKSSMSAAILFVISMLVLFFHSVLSSTTSNSDASKRIQLKFGPVVSKILFLDQIIVSVNEFCTFHSYTG